MLIFSLIISSWFAIFTTFGLSISYLLDWSLKSKRSGFWLLLKFNWIF